MAVIVVPVANRPECGHALEVAFDLATRLDAHVQGYHLHPHKGDSDKIPRKSGPAKAAQTLFEELAEKADVPVKKKITPIVGPAAHWAELLGNPDKVMPIIAPMSDLLVVSRPKGTGKGLRGKTARNFLLAALQSAGRPTLVLPQRRLKTLGSRIMIAWDQSPAAIQALIGAMPLLKKADHVLIHCAGVDFQVAPKAHHAKAYLAMHGIKARLTKSRGLYVNQELEEAFESSECDLLVMGAYSRPRLMEQVLGGSSEHFIMKSKLPVLVTHPRS